MLCSELMFPVSPVIFVGPKFHNAVVFLGKHVLGEMIVFGELSFLFLFWRTFSVPAT